jgi:hypothetical protein
MSKKITEMKDELTLVKPEIEMANMPHILKTLGFTGTHWRGFEDKAGDSTNKTAVFEKIRTQADGENKVFLCEIKHTSDSPSHFALGIGASKEDPNKIVFIDSAMENPIFAVDLNLEPGSYVSQLTGLFIDLHKDKPIKIELI